MTPSQLIDSIEQAGLVDPRILAKIKRELDNPTKPIKPKAIIKFLVDKGELTAAQGEKLLAGQWQPPKQLRPEPAFEVKQPVKAEFDTDDLTSVAQAVAVVPAKSPAPAVPPVVPVTAVEGTRVYNVSEAIEPAEEVAVPVVIQPTEMYDPLQETAGFSSQSSPFGSSLSSDSGTSGPTVTQFAGKKDKTDQWATKWIYIGGALLAVLLVVGAVLTLSVFREPPEKLFEAAEKSYLEGNYLDAVQKATDFADTYPNHEKASMARVRVVQSLLWHAHSSKNYKDALAIATEKIPTIEKESAFDLIREDFGTWFPTIAVSFSQSVLNEKERSIDQLKAGLVKAEEAGRVLDFLTGDQRRNDQIAATLEKYDNDIKTIRGLIDKETSYASGLKEIDELANQNKPIDAFNVFNRLTRTYGDLGARQPLRDAMKKATASEINLITPSKIQPTASTSEPSSPAERKLTLVSRYGTPTPALQDELLPYLIEGYLYMISGRDGSIIWDRFLGIESLIRPLWANPVEKTEILAFDE